MSISTWPVLAPYAAPWCTSQATFALWISFLLGRQLTLGHEPPIHRRSTTAVRRPDRAMCHARSFPPAPLPRTRMSKSSVFTLISPGGCGYSPSGASPGTAWTQRSRGEKLLEQTRGVVRVLLREEVATLHRLPVRVPGPLPPDAKRTATLCIQRVERAALGPQMRHRAFDSLRRLLVGPIVLHINRGRRSILFTDSMDASRIAIG